MSLDLNLPPLLGAIHEMEATTLVPAPEFHVPGWAEGTLVGLLLLLVAFPVMRGSVRRFVKQETSAATMDERLLQANKDLMQQLADERKNASVEIAEERKAAATILSEERANSKVLQQEVLQLSRDLVASGQTYGQQLMGEINKVSNNHTDSMKRVFGELANCKALHEACEKGRADETLAYELRDAARTKAEERQYASFTAQLDGVYSLLSRITGAPAAPVATTVPTGTTIIVQQQPGPAAAPDSAGT